MKSLIDVRTPRAANCNAYCGRQILDMQFLTWKLNCWDATPLTFMRYWADRTQKGWRPSAKFHLHLKGVKFDVLCISKAQNSGFRMYTSFVPSLQYDEDTPRRTQFAEKPVQSKRTPRCRVFSGRIYTCMASSNTTGEKPPKSSEF